MLYDEIMNIYSHTGSETLLHGLECHLWAQLLKVTLILLKPIQMFRKSRTLSYTGLLTYLNL